MKLDGPCWWLKIRRQVLQQSKGNLSSKRASIKFQSFHEIGQGMAGPTMMLYATENEKNNTFIMAKVKKFGVSFCKAGAGSDLTELDQAELDGDTWTINS